MRRWSSFRNSAIFFQIFEFSAEEAIRQSFEHFVLSQKRQAHTHQDVLVSFEKGGLVWMSKDGEEEEESRGLCTRPAQLLLL
jgi:hypothetical protein